MTQLVAIPQMSYIGLGLPPTPCLALLTLKYSNFTTTHLICCALIYICLYCLLYIYCIGRNDFNNLHKSLFTKVRDTSGPLTVPSSHPYSSGRVKRGSLLGFWYTLTSRVVFLLRQYRQSRQSAKPFLQTSELGLSQPLTRRRVCPPHPLVWGGGHTRWRERGLGESQFRREDIHCGTLYICVLCDGTPLRPS